MKIESQVSEALNAQINNELRASYVYLAMAAHFDSDNLKGFASFFRRHAGEEIDHAMRIYDFIVKRGGTVELKGIAMPDKNFHGPAAAIRTALAMEADVTGQIHKLFELAHEVKEYGTQNMLHWFLEEQIDEEDLFRDLLEQAEAAGDSRWHLMVLDNRLLGTAPPA